MQLLPLLTLLVLLIPLSGPVNAMTVGDSYPPPGDGVEAPMPFRRLSAFRPQDRPNRPPTRPPPPPPTTTKSSTSSSPPTTKPPTAAPTSNPPATSLPTTKPVTTAPTTQPQDWKVALLNAVNNERAKANLAPLCLTSKLIASAQGHATDMATNNYFDHNSQDGTDPFTRMRRQGYTGGNAENIAAGYTTVQDVMTGWMNSPGHRANILGGASQLGVGMAYNAGSAYGYYWVQNFGTSSTEPCMAV